MLAGSVKFIPFFFVPLDTVKGLPPLPRARFPDVLCGMILFISGCSVKFMGLHHKPRLSFAPPFEGHVTTSWTFDVKFP